MNGEIVSLMAQGALPSARLDEPVLGPAAGPDVARFDNAMASPVTADIGVPNIADVARSSWSDAFMHSMQEFGRSYAEQSSQIKHIMSDNAHDLGAMDLLRIQVGLVETSMQVELASRFVQKATQHIDQLTKLQ